MIEYVYGLIYKPGVNIKSEFVYLTSDLNEARRFAQNIYPGTILVALQVLSIDA